MRNEIDLKTAVREIRQGCVGQINTPFRPFFFIVGAGISSPPIPLAAAITDECRSKAVAAGAPSDVTKDTAMDRYSYWFDGAYPHAADRVAYLHDIIHGRPISPANLRLAHILESGQLADIVVTPNFDDLLARGLSLFGKDFTECDHPQTAVRIDPECHDIVQIVHVHGTYWFYDCCNLKDELTDRSSSSDKTTATMGSLLDRILAKRSPLVVGYSGWDEDVIMSALCRRLRGQRLGYRLYWFCHRTSDRDSLPEWLRDHQDVRLVLAENAIGAKTTLQSESGEPTTTTTSEPGAIDRRSADTLSAQLVMDAFVQGFSLPAPRFTTDPLGFYSEHLKRSVIHEQSDAPGDLYGIAGVISRISLARDLEAQQRQALEESLEEIRDSLRRSAYPEVIARAIEVNPSHLSRLQSEDLMQAIAYALESSATTPTEQFTKACNLLLSMAETANSNTPSENHRFRIGIAIYRKALHVLNVKKDPAAAISLLQDLVTRFSSPESKLRRFVALGRYYIGVALRAQNDIDGALEVFNELVKEFGPEARPAAIWWYGRS